MGCLVLFSDGVSVAQAGLELVAVLLLEPPECGDTGVNQHT